MSPGPRAATVERSPDGPDRLPSTSAGSTPRALDASMDLLNQIIQHPVDPDYAVAAARGGGRARLRWPLALVALVIGAMFAVSAVETTRAAPAAETERTELISRVQRAEAQQDELRARVTSLSAEIAKLRAAAAGTSDEAELLERQINTLDPMVGNVAVTGPGITVTVDDAVPGTLDVPSTDQRNQVLDIDLQAMVNGLWLAGAEAVAVNGHRLSSLTAIRGAGDAITVDFRSLARPYRVQALGDPKTLQAHYVESAGGLWWNELAQNRGMRYEISSEEQITLPADPGLVLRHARKAES